MNLNHLGDALDFWKGSLMSRLAANLNNIHVFPMFTDRNVRATWTAPRLVLYESLLGVPCNQNRILNPNMRFNAYTRRKYFSNPNPNLPADADVFVDPDTGIEPPGRNHHRHIRYAEIAQLLPQNTKRMVLIYQHSFRKSNWASNCLQRVINASAMQNCSAFAYWAGSVSMVFVARDRTRLVKVHQLLHGFMSSLPNNLIRALPIIP